MQVLLAGSLHTSAQFFQHDKWVVIFPKSGDAAFDMGIANQQHAGVVFMRHVRAPLTLFLRF